MDEMIVVRLCGELCAKAGLDAAPAREPLRAWSLSSVERLRFTDGSTAVLKCAAEPFTGEDRALTLAADRGVPVPRLYASAVRDHVLGMVMEDLGEPVREAEDPDGAAAAAVLHAVGAVEALAVCDAAVLGLLPERALGHLTALRRSDRWSDVSDIADMLHALREAACARVIGARTAPFGLCHSEFHPTSLHIGADRWRLLDFARAFNGPGLLDLASWDGTLRQADPRRLRDLIDSYVAAGGHREALADRGGLTAETWALGWHRMWAVEWFMDQAVRWIADPTTDPVYIRTVRRHVAEAVHLLAA